MLRSKPNRTNGVSTIGESDGGRVIVRWESSYKIGTLVRGLLGKAFNVGFSSKEYLILFDIISSHFRSLGSGALEKVLVVLFLLSSSRKAITNWDMPIPPLKRTLPKILKKLGSMKNESDLRREYDLNAFLSVRLTKEQFSMKVSHSRSLPARLIHRVRNPSAVGTKHNRKLSKLPSGFILPHDSRTRTLDEEITLTVRKLYSFLGIQEATPLPYVEREIPADEPVGKGEIPEGESMFEKYLRRVES